MYTFWKCFEDEEVEEENFIEQDKEIKTVDLSKTAKEVSNIISSKKNKDNNCVSLYDTIDVFKNMCKQYNTLINKYEKQFNYIIRTEHGYSTGLAIYGFDYEKKELDIGYKVNKTHDRIHFSKKRGALYIKSSETDMAGDILNLLGKELSELYDALYRIFKYRKEFNRIYEIINTNFSSTIIDYNFSLDNRILVYCEDFVLYLDNKLNIAEYRYDSNSNIVLREIRGRVETFLKKLYIKIEDFPEWCQPILYEIRQNELAEEERIEQEEKKQKRKELVRKVFPFIKEEK